MEMEEKIVIIDANGLVLGRMASTVAKRLLQGENVMIINAEKAVISGKRKSKVKEAKEFLDIGHPTRGPFHPRRPDQIVRRTVRGMLPWKQPKGKQAYKRLRVFFGVPKELKNINAETLPEASANKLRCPYLTVGELAKEVGWKPVGE